MYHFVLLDNGREARQAALQLDLTERLQLDSYVSKVWTIEWIAIHPLPVGECYVEYMYACMHACPTLMV